MADARPWADLPALHDALDGATAAAFAESGDGNGWTGRCWRLRPLRRRRSRRAALRRDTLDVIFTAIGRAASAPETAEGWRLPQPELGD